MSNSTLAAIQTKVRRLTRSPSEAQISTAQINEYINTFVLYDFPEHLRLFDLRTTLTFYTEPYIDTYQTTTTIGDPLYNFKNRYISIHKPIYVAGYDTFFSQSREQFFAIYPKLSSIASIGTTGDGLTTAFSGTLSSFPILLNNVLFSSVDTTNNGLALTDTPTVPFDGTGTLSGDGTGTINYITGAYILNFSVAPASSQAINSQTVPYVASRPLGMLFFDNKMILRPVPDQPYRVDLEVYIRPTDWLDAETGKSPDIEQWWQYIAVMSAKKILEDRMDQESVQLILPLCKEQEMLVLRKTIVQQTNERTATIYTEQVGLGSGGHSNTFGTF